MMVKITKNGATGRIRTSDRPLRRRMLYPAELRLHTLEVRRNIVSKALSVNRQSAKLGVFLMIKHVYVKNLEQLSDEITKGESLMFVGSRTSTVIPYDTLAKCEGAPVTKLLDTSF